MEIAGRSMQHMPNITDLYGTILRFYTVDDGGVFTVSTDYVVLVSLLMNGSDLPLVLDRVNRISYISDKPSPSTLRSK